MRLLRPLCSALLFVQTRGTRKMSSRVATHKLVAQGTTLTLEPNTAATGTVLLMHGLGDTAHGWIGTVKGFLAPAMPHVRFILPTAPTVPVTLNGGFPMPAWYDIESLARSRVFEKANGIHTSRKTITTIIDEQVERGIPSDRIVLSGFSQGGAMTLFTGLEYPNKLGGMGVLSGYLPLPSDVHPTEASLQTPIRFFHGDEDDVVRLEYGRDAESRVRQMGAKDVQFKEYEGLPHSASDEEMMDFLAFLKTRLPTTQ